MNAFVEGFAGEVLAKSAGVLRLVAKHPFAALQAGAIGAATVPAAYEGFRRGMAGDKPRYLQASRYGPSEAFSTNFHEALPHEADAAERMRMSYHYNRGALGGK